MEAWEIRDDGKIACPACSGRGTYHEPPVDGIGAAYVWDDCGTCDGTGYLTFRQAISNARLLTDRLDLLDDLASWAARRLEVEDIEGADFRLICTLREIQRLAHIMADELIVTGGFITDELAQKMEYFLTVCA